LLFFNTVTIFVIVNQRNTGAIASVYMHFLNICDIILVGDNIIMLLS